MRHLYFSFALALLVNVNVKAGQTVLSPFSKLSVLTCDPGTEAYAIFGHSAIRVQDPVSHLDVVFNYGTFNFSDPNFYGKFLQGRLTYYLSVTSFNDFLEEYKENHQRVREQVLNLQPIEVQKLWDRLQENLKEENRYYKYDFFYDNCSTRIRDDIKWIYAGRLRVNDGTEGEKRSFRQEISPYFINNSWTGFGIDISIGLPADKHPTQDERMFLPANLYNAIAHSSIGHMESIVSAVATYDFSNPGYGPTTMERNMPVIVCWVLFAIALLIFALEAGLKKRLAFFDYIIFTLTGLAGVGLLCLWCFTDYSITKLNQNLLWASPLNLVAVCLGTRLKQAYFFYYSIVLVALLLCFLVASRYFHPAVLPLVLSLLLRCAGIAKYKRRTLLKNKSGFSPSL